MKIYFFDVQLLVRHLLFYCNFLYYTPFQIRTAFGGDAFSSGGSQAPPDHLFESSSTGGGGGQCSTPTVTDIHRWRHVRVTYVVKVICSCHWSTIDWWRRSRRRAAAALFEVYTRIEVTPMRTSWPPKAVCFVLIWNGV